MSTSLLLTRRFAPLFWCQFFSAFSDNFLKNALVFLIVYQIGGDDADALTQLAAAVFIAPYFFLSALGGEVADRHDKAMIAQRLKLAEIGVALIAIAGFVMHSVPILFVALFGFGVIGSLFGPIKYGILPDLLQRSELPAANALVEGATFLAILLGTIVGGLAAKDGGDPASFAGLMIFTAVACWGASLFIPRTGEAAPDLKISGNIAARSPWSSVCSCCSSCCSSALSTWASSSRTAYSVFSHHWHHHSPPTRIRSLGCQQYASLSSGFR